MPKRKWYSLIDKVWRMDNLQAAAERVLVNRGVAGMDGQTCKAFVDNPGAELQQLHEELRAKAYQPQPVPPQGGVIRPLLANIYLHAFDVRMTERGHRLVRYADDWLILCGSKRAAERVMVGAKLVLEAERGLQVHPEKSRVVGAEEGCDFLGYRFWAKSSGREEGPHWYHGRRSSDKSLERCQNRLWELTRCNQTVSTEELAYNVRKYLQGWVGYFGWGQSKNRFGEMDAWLRRRFRMVVMRGWRSCRKVHSILIRRGWKREKLVGFSPYRWRNSRCPMVHAALDTRWLHSVGFRGLLDYYLELSPVRG